MCCIPPARCAASTAQLGRRQATADLKPASQSKALNLVLIVAPSARSVDAGVRVISHARYRRFAITDECRATTRLCRSRARHRRNKITRSRRNIHRVLRRVADGAAAVSLNARTDAVMGYVDRNKLHVVGLSTMSNSTRPCRSCHET